MTDTQLIQAIRDHAHSLADAAGDFDPLLDAVGPARLVLLGEASHGTHEFYHARAQITRRLVEEKGFTAVTVEADWPDAYRVNRYVRGVDDDPDAAEALAGFERFPQWMWRNANVLDFVGWLRAHNDALPPGRPKAGFYGMDLYSLYRSIGQVLEYLDATDHAASTRARFRYACFEDFGEDPQAYGYAAGCALGRSCEDQVVQQLVDLTQHAGELTRFDGQSAKEAQFHAEQNARLVKDAEQYYRSMFKGGVSSWNLRDQHMARTVEELLKYLDRLHPDTKMVIWAHNSHLGDARATEMGRGGELNVGQLLRQTHGPDAFNVGFTTHTGTVTAADNWDEPADFKDVNPSLPGSYERLFHDTRLPGFLLLPRQDRSLAAALNEPRLERAIGVIYRPQSERISHYFNAHLADQFDAVIHFDRSRAVEPLERSPLWRSKEVPEAYPTGI
jgi:erythromycin esterase-like protein